MVAGVHGIALERVLLPVEVGCSDLRGSATTRHPRMEDCHVQEWITSLSSAICTVAQVIMKLSSVMLDTIG